MRSFLEQVSFGFEDERSQDQLTLTTIHQSKGLEWPLVCIVRVNEGYLTSLPFSSLTHNSSLPSLYTRDNISLTPHAIETNSLAKTLSEQNEQFAALEEERRLFYVATTRAEKTLLISHIVYDHNSVRLARSRFLDEMKSSCVLASRGTLTDCDNSHEQKKSPVLPSLRQRLKSRFGGTGHLHPSLFQPCLVHSSEPLLCLNSNVQERKRNKRKRSWTTKATKMKCQLLYQLQRMRILLFVLTSRNAALRKKFRIPRSSSDLSETSLDNSNDRVKRKTPSPKDPRKGKQQRIYADSPGEEAG